MQSLNNKITLLQTDLERAEQRAEAVSDNFMRIASTRPKAKRVVTS
jgi:hypothetical protein